MLREISSPFPSLRTTLYIPDSLKCREMKNMSVKNLRDHFPGSLRQTKRLSLSQPTRFVHLSLIITICPSSHNSKPGEPHIG